MRLSYHIAQLPGIPRKSDAISMGFVWINKGKCGVYGYRSGWNQMADEETLTHNEDFAMIDHISDGSLYCAPKHSRAPWDLSIVLKRTEAGTLISCQNVVSHSAEKKCSVVQHEWPAVNICGSTEGKDSILPMVWRHIPVLLLVLYVMSWATIGSELRVLLVPGKHDDSTTPQLTSVSTKYMFL